METLVQERTRLEYHPSFDRGMPAIIAEPIPVGYCEVCAWLAGRIRAGRHTEDYGWLAIRHVEAVHGGAS